jgi:nucleoside-diphosphate-sugar epimerase
MDLRGRAVLVTGAGGFIGSRLVDRLVIDGARVTALVRASRGVSRRGNLKDALDVRVADIRDASLVREVVASTEPEYVVNLARVGVGPGKDGPAELLDTNTIGTANLIEPLADTHCRRFVHLGSSQEYGPRDYPMKESDPIAPVTLYGASKAAATLIALARCSELDVEAVVLRPFYVYGPGEPPSRLVSRAVEAAMTGATLPLSPRATRRDWVYVDDVVEACVRALVAPEVDGMIFNVGTGRDRTNLEVVRAVEAAAGRPVRVRADPRQVRALDTERWRADTLQSERVLGWRPRRTLEEGVAEMVGRPAGVPFDRLGSPSST